MRRSVIAILLCVLAATASAQCVTQAKAAGGAQPGAELIKTAATTREQTLPADDGLPSVQEAAASKSTDKQQPHRAGPAMLLAAVALMSGIALRRFSAHMR